MSPNNLHFKPIIFGCAGPRLIDTERELFRLHRPVGLIVFARNCESPSQLKALTAEFRDLVGHPDALVLIDQEGGRVARLRPPHWRATLPAGNFARLAETSPEKAETAVYWNARLMAEELVAAGINVDCAPLADIPVAGAHDIIGDRAYGTEPSQVIRLTRKVAEGLSDGGVWPVLKHIPGHGRARDDSHETLPIVDAPLDVLRSTDFVPFKALADLPFGMTAHILYTALDQTRPATLSPEVISLIREEIGFKGLLMSDDLSMKALKGDMGELAQQVLAAGCDLVLHCTGKLEEMTRIADAVDFGSETFQHKLAALFSTKPAPQPVDHVVADAALEPVLRIAQAV